MTLSPEIAAAVNDAIAKHLPMEIGNHLRQRLEQAEADRKRADDLKATNTDLKCRVDQLERAVQSERTIELRIQELNKRETEIIKKEVELKHSEEITKLHREHSREDINLMRDLVESVFCSPVVREILVNSKQVPMVSQQGYHTGTAYHEDKTTKTTEVVKPGDGQQPR